MSKDIHTEIERVAYDLPTIKAWLRKFYPPGTDEPHFDLTPATERALAWLGTLGERSFVGTESRLLTLFDLLRQMNEGSETDPEARVRELQRKRDAIDAEIERVRTGDVPMMGDTALKERFVQFTGLARELLADFREVEQNFRGLDRRVRERIALWDGAKGALLQDILGERDLINESDQGRSFRAFWDFLMSSRRQEELSERLDQVRTSPQDLDLLRHSYLRNAAARHPVDAWTDTDVAFLAADLAVTPEWVRSHLPDVEEVAR